MARNPIIRQRELAALAAAKAKSAPPPPPPSAGQAAPKVTKPVNPKIALDTLPDKDLKERAKVLYGLDYDPTWNREQLIEKLLDKGATA